MKSYLRSYWKNTTANKDEQLGMIQELAIADRRNQTDLDRIQRLQKKIYRRSHTKIWAVLVLLFASQLFLNHSVKQHDDNTNSTTIFNSCNQRNDTTAKQITAFKALRDVELQNASLTSTMAIPGRDAVISKRIAAYNMLIETTPPQVNCNKLKH